MPTASAPAAGAPGNGPRPIRPRPSRAPAMNGREGIVELLRWQEAGCRLSMSPSPFYAALLARLASAAERGGPVVTLLARAPATVEAAAPLRLLGGVHRAVLDGTLPELAEHWPGDADAAWDVLEQVLAAPPPAVIEALGRDPQTNEVGRAAALVVGLAEVARRTRLPLRLLEIGASAGLNLRLDRYWYEAGRERYGDATANVRFDGDAYRGEPPLSAMTEIVDRRGCDLHPIDAATIDGQRRLVSYVWPDQGHRMQRLRAALAVAPAVPVTIDRRPADDWVGEHLVATPQVTTVLMHSITWQYLAAGARERIVAVAHERGAAATADAPLVWLRLEPSAAVVHAELRLTSWPGGDDVVLAKSGYHGPPVTVPAST